MSLVNTKSLLAKLLASENLTVEHGNYPTASMDVKNRVLRLPIWKEMSGSLYDLMVLHEVGHALYTPEDGWHGASSDKGNGYKSFLNVVEDARIERKIKDKYPGGRRAFKDGYLDLIKRDFFGLRSVDPNELNLIDRINLHFKGGTVHDIAFSDEELEFVEKVRGTLTWDDVVRVTDELYEYAKDHDSETDMSDHSEMVYGDDYEDYDDEDGEAEDSHSGNMNDVDSDFSEMLENLRNDLESGEEKEEGSGSSTGSGEGEGESEEEGKSAGDSAGKDGDETDNAKAGDEKTDERGNSDMNSMGSGAGVGTPNFDGEDYKPRSITDDNFRSREDELVVDENATFKINYANLPKAHLKNIIIDYKEIHKTIRDHYVSTDINIGEDGTKQIPTATTDFLEFRSKNKKTVEYLAKEFEMKKAADAHTRTATANSGIISTSLLHTYKYNEHIFKKINVTSDGKNHGLIMVVDWSGSMGNNITGTIEQMMVLVMFAKRVNIPFEVFLFSDTYPSEVRRHEGSWSDWTHEDGGKNGDLIIDSHNLLNVFSSRMRANEIHAAYINMTAIANAYDRSDRGHSSYYRGYKTLPSEFHLGGTPLNASLLAINTLVPEFKAKSNVQIVNLIYLTDGDSSGGETIWDRRTFTETRLDGGDFERTTEVAHLGSSRSFTRSNNTQTIVRDTVTKREYERSGNRRTFSRGQMTNLLVEILRDKHDVNVVNFFIIPKLGRHNAVEFIDKKTAENSDMVLTRWRKEGHLIAENYGGWSELYLIKGGKALGVEESLFEVKDEAKKGDIKRAFSKFNKGKLKNRLLLSKFVDMIAA